MLDVSGLEGLLFDTHIHVHQLKDADRFVTPCLVPAVCEDDWPKMRQLDCRDGQLWLALGVHPLHAGQWREASATRLTGLLEDPRVIAIGEIGLDKRLTVPLEIQEQVLRSQLRLAVTHGKPVILHAVHSFERLLAVLEEENVRHVGGVVHGFYGSVETARHLERLNLVLGIGRLVLDPNAKKLPHVIDAVQQQTLVVETDAPWRELREDWCEPWYEILDRIAQLRGWTRQQALDITDENARSVFRLAQKGV